jgi:hypothetical protein
LCFIAREENKFFWVCASENKLKGRGRKRTLMEYASGNNVSGFIASSGKFFKACISFSKGNLT